MRQSILLIFIFVSGWTLSWIYFNKKNDPGSSTSAITVPLSVTTAKPGADLHSSPNAPRNITAPTSDSELDIIKDLIVQGEYESAMLRYPDLLTSFSEVDINRLQQFILDLVAELISTNKTFKAHRLLLLYLNNEFDDVGALELLAQINLLKKNNLAAIDTLYKAKSYAHTSEKIAQLTDLIRAAVSQYKAVLTGRKDYLALLDLYKRLTELEPDYALYFVGLAETYLNLGNRVDARQALELTLQNPNTASKANELMLTINKIPSFDLIGSVDIPLIVMGDQFLVKARINNEQHAVLLLDTGASLSIISSRLFNLLDLSYQRTYKSGWFNTANGRVQAPIVSVNNLSLNGQSVDNLEVGIIDVSTPHFEGLLGMNFLRHFEFFIDQKSQVLRLSAH